MPTPQLNIRSAGVTASATLSLLGSASALLVWGWFFQGLVALPRDAHGRQAYQSHPIAFFSLALVPPILIAMGLRMGVGLFQLKPWDLEPRTMRDAKHHAVPLPSALPAPDGARLAPFVRRIVRRLLCRVARDSLECSERPMAAPVAFALRPCRVSVLSRTRQH